MIVKPGAGKPPHEGGSLSPGGSSRLRREGGKNMMDARKQGQRPNYYRFRCFVRSPGAGTERADQIVEVEAQDIIEALGLSFSEGNVLKYLVRAGRKTEERGADLAKVLTYARFAVAEEDRRRYLDALPVKEMAERPCSADECDGELDVKGRCSRGHACPLHVPLSEGNRS